VGSPRADQPDPLASIAADAIIGDARAVRTFLAAITPHIVRIARKVLGANHSEVEDVAQECAFAVLEALPTHRGECSTLSFACRIAVLQAMNVRRRAAAKKRASHRDHEAEVELLASDLPSPDDELVAQARAQLVRELLDTLPVAQAEVLAMHSVLGYTVGEIADASRAPVETVRSRLRLARTALRERIATSPRLRRMLT
jgi:RNA polymerase sigma-70 factor (ECF subfamily)